MQSLSAYPEWPMLSRFSDPTSWRAGLSSSINGLLEPLDRLYLRNKVVNDCMPLFVLGAPRSGTTLTYQLVCHCYRTAYLTRYMNVIHGLHGWLYSISRPLLPQGPAVFQSNHGQVPGYLLPAESGNLWSRWLPWAKGSSHYIESGMLPSSVGTDLFAHLAALQSVAGRPFVFKSVYLSLAVAFLARCLPEARFIMVTRDTADTAISLYRKRCQQKKPEIWWSVIPPDVSRLLELPLEIQVTEQVMQVEQILRDDLHQNAPGRFLEVHYEALCNSPLQAVAEMDAWLVPAGYEVNPRRTLPGSFHRRRSVAETESGVMQSIQQHIERSSGGNHNIQ